DKPRCALEHLSVARMTVCFPGLAIGCELRCEVTRVLMPDREKDRHAEFADRDKRIRAGRGHADRRHRRLERPRRDRYVIEAEIFARVGEIRFRPGTTYDVERLVEAFLTFRVRNVI